MERVVYLESDEEITSVLDKLEKTEDQSVILVIPKNATILQSLVNLKLLSKKAIELKKEIALVTSDKIGRNLASLAGLSVYAELKEKGKIKPSQPQLPPPPGIVVKTYSPSLERLEEPKPTEALRAEPPLGGALPPKPPKPPTKLPFKFPHIPFAFWGSLILSFIVVFIILYFVLPKATVTLKLKTEVYAQSTELVVDQKAITPDFDNKIIKGEVKELEKEGEKSWPSTGKKNIGVKAKGTITITNSFKNPDGSGSDITLKAAAEFKDKKTNKIFLSDSSVTVPRLTYDPNNGQPIPGTASVKVTASEPGESYNIGPSDFTIPNLNLSSVTGRSSENMSGGYDKFVSVVSQGDIDKAKEETSKEVLDKAKEELKNNLEKGQKFLEGAVKEDVLSTNSSEKVDAVGSEFQMQVKVKVTTLIVSEKDYKDLLAKFLESTLPPDKRLVSTPEDSVDLSLISYDSTLQIMRLKATLNTQVAPKMDENRLKEDIARKNSQEATAYLKSLNEVEDVRIQIWPFWAKKLPQADKIKIKILP